MIKLSDRLQKIADLIQQGETVADIGTDHGFLPMALWESGISPHVILSDINSGPLEKARVNIDKYFPEWEFDVRLGSGLSSIQPGEVDAVVIAGMGGQLISEILGEDLDKTRTFKRMILQPRNGQDKLREWLFLNGFQIYDESLVREGKYLCEIIAVLPGNIENSPGNMEMDLEVSPVLFAKQDPLLVEFIENKIRIEKKILDAVKNGVGKDKYKKLEETEHRIKLLEELRKRSLA